MPEIYLLPNRYERCERHPLGSFNIDNQTQVNYSIQ